jgi:hypothetical protein
MNKDFFPRIEDALSEADELTRLDRDDSHDRAVISAFYNGRPTMSETEAEREGITELTNHLFGYDSINQAKSQLSSIYSVNNEVWHVELPEAPVQVRQEWEQRLSKKWNEILKRSGRLKPEYESICGDATLYGRGTFFFRDRYGWCPRHCEPLVPRRAGVRPDEIPYVMMRQDITLRDLERNYRAAKRGNAPGWKAESLEKIIGAMMESIAPGTGVLSSLTATDYDSPEEVEHDRQGGVVTSEAGRTLIPVYYIYTSRPKEEGCPWDLTIMLRQTSMPRAGGKMEHLDPVLFDQERFVTKACHFLHPFFMDSNIGGRVSWHRVMGLGRLNYDTDVDVEEFFNEAMQGAKENVRRLYQVANSADIEMMDRWLAGGKYSNVLPEGVNIAQAQQNPNFQYAFSVIDMLKQNSARHAAASISNNRGERGANELEVQALERQGRNAQVLANRISEWYDNMDSLGMEVFRRFIQPGAINVDEGYWEIREFHRYLDEEAGIPIDWLRHSKKGQPPKYIIRTNRSAGEGDRVRQVMVNRMLLERLPLFSPEAQEIIKRRVVASETNDYDFAEQIVPIEQKPPGDQIARANVENQSALLRGIADYVPPINSDDIHGVHVPEHLGALQALNAKGASEGWKPTDAAGFRSIGAHAAAHLQLIEQADPNMAREGMDALQQLAREAQEHEANMQQQMEAQQVSPMDQAKMQKMEHDAAMNERKQMALEEHRAAALDLSERKAASAEMQGAGNLALQEQQLSAKVVGDASKQADKRISEREKMAETRRQQAIQGEASGKTPGKSE